MEQQLSNEMQEDILKLMGYVSKIRETGALDIFSKFFQSDYRILNFLRTHKDAHPSTIAEQLRLTRPNVAANLRLLESKGFIIRQGNEHNHREVFVNITEKGKSYLTLVDRQCASLFIGWFAILGEEETKHLFKILEISSNPQLITDDLKNFSFGD